MMALIVTSITRFLMLGNGAGCAIDLGSIAKLFNLQTECAFRVWNVI